MSSAQTFPEPTLFQRLLADGIPSTLLIDLVDPEGMRVALASELMANDVDLARAPQLASSERVVRSA